jgi:hypothetical protein
MNVNLNFESHVTCHKSSLDFQLLLWFVIARSNLYFVCFFLSFFLSVSPFLI